MLSRPARFISASAFVSAQEDLEGGTAAGRAEPSGLLASARSPLYTNALFVWINQAGAGLSGFLFWALAARLFDTADVGLGSAAFSILTLLSMLATLGFGLGLIRFYAEAGDDALRLTNAVFTGSTIAGFLFSAVFLAGIPLWAPSLDFLLDNPLYAVAFASFVAAGTVTIVQTQAFMAVRTGRYIFYQVLVVQLSRLVLPAVFASFTGAFGVVASTGIARILGAIYSFWLMARGVPGYRPAWLFDVPALWRLLPFSMANYVANFLIIAPSLLMPVMVVSVLGATQGAYFYIAWFIGFLPVTFSTSLGTSLFAEGSLDPQALRRLVRRSLISGMSLSAVASVALLALAEVLLLAFGQAYADEGAMLLRIMALAAIPAAAVNVYIGALRVQKRNWELITVTAIGAFSTIALGRALLKPVGLEGAGIAHGTGQLLSLLYVLIRVVWNAEGSVIDRVRGLLAGLRSVPGEAGR